MENNKKVTTTRRELRLKKESIRKQALLTKAVLAGTGLTLTFGMGIASAAAAPQTNETNNAFGITSDNNENNVDLRDSEALDGELLGEENLMDLIDRGIISENEKSILSLNLPTEEDEEEVVVEEEEEPYEAYVAISSSGEDRTFTIRNDDETVLEALEERDLNVSGYRDEDGQRIEPEDLEKLVLKNEETLFLHSHERSVDKEDVVLDYITEEIETDDLYIGETKQEQEGIDGSALKITLTSGYGEEQVTSERLTIVNAPQREIVKVGTKERPEDSIEVINNGEYRIYDGNGGYTDLDGDPIDGDELSGDPIDGDELSGDPIDGDELSDGEDGFGDRLDLAGDSEGLVSGNAIVDTMLTQVGNRYVWGGTTPEGGFDCSGIIQWAYAQEGKTIPRVSGAQGRAGTPVSWENIQVGDFIWSDSHIGVYAGNGKIIHALNPRAGIRLDSVDYWRAQGLQVSRL